MSSDSIRLNNICIRNYKGLDVLEVEFPRPRVENDPDILVMGGENGIGKSSFMECCALALMAQKIKNLKFPVFWDLLHESFNPLTFRLPDLLVRNGESVAEIEAEIERKNVLEKIKITINNEGLFVDDVSECLYEDLEFNTGYLTKLNDICLSICSLLGYSSDPVIDNSFLYFHSFRNVRFSAPELRGIAGRKFQEGAWDKQPINLFKITLLNSLMAGANLLDFEIVNSEKKNNGGKVPEDPSIKSLNFLNSIVKKYTGGKIDKLKSLTSNASYDFRIEIGNRTFSFDGLGSGHKEVISTLFLIWYYTNEDSKVVFIDEPELHFNAQWHESFLSDAITHPETQKPYNQLIIATHSKRIMGSVDKYNRVGLEI